MYTCAWEFFIMKTRLIIHYSDGETFTGEWNKYHPFKDLNTKNISSLQIQSSSDKLYTLSSKKKQCSEFYSRQSKDIIAILKRIHRNIWIELEINKFTEDRTVNVINSQSTI